MGLILKWNTALNLNKSAENQIYFTDKSTMTEELTYEQFAQNRNGKFKVHISPESVVELDVDELSEFKKSALQERFWLVFRGPIKLPLGQGTYLFENDGMGQFYLFMTPIRENAESRFYEVIFNRIVDSRGVTNG